MLSRTQLLASVSHDLQTPLTRMRLRLEQVRESELREKLIHDVQVMQTLVREGLDLASSHETREPWSLVDIDSPVESLAEVSGARITLRNHPGGGLVAEIRLAAS